jgi:hypothetical protein
MGTSAIFPQAPLRKGIYESFYLRAVAPQEPLGVWIRYTVSKPPGGPPRGSIWCSVFDAARGRPFQHKLTSERLSAPSGGWIEIGGAPGQPVAGLGAEREGGGGGGMSAEEARGSCGIADWSLRTSSQEPELHHLPREWLYRAPLPRTKLTSPAPAARFDGRLGLADDREIDLQGWQGMIGHNWGSEHAERWIWLHGVGFEEAPDAWIDVALGRVMVAGRMTPWIANGVISLDGRRLRIGGLGARGLRVAETPEGCTLRLIGEHGLTVDARVEVPAGTAAGWHYGDPDGGAGHDVVNCSIAAVSLTVAVPGVPQQRSLRSAHGGVYELGMRERDHGVPIAPFED